MKFIEKMAAKQNDLFGVRQPCIAFLGDSVTQGCFELYDVTETTLETYFDSANAYHAHLIKKLAVLFPRVTVVAVNAGISGDTAPNGYKRLERDVLSYRPDLVVVCFGLNDCGSGDLGLNSYKNAMDGIFSKILESGAEAVALTPNDVASYLSPHLRFSNDKFVRACTEQTIENAKNGFLDKYVDAMREAAKKHSVPICDVYARYKRLQSLGADTTEFLANYANHPKRDINEMTASMLLTTLIES